MKALNTLKFHPTSEKIVDILCQKTQNTNPMFFRVLISYYLTKLCSMMRVKIATQDRGEIPVNLYAINLAASGQGKGFSTNIIEDQIINQFRSVFLEETYPVIVEENLAQLAVKRAAIKNEDPDLVLQSIIHEFKQLGTLAFSFDSGTTPAVKQFRHQLLMAGIGSLNLEIDEIGNNLLGNADVLSSFLELFDIGKIKQKLTKNTKENIRSEEIEGKTPTNLLLFGTPAKLLDGSKTEEEFYSFLETGYARRCLFGFTRYATKNKSLTPLQVYDQLINTNTNQYLKDLSLTLSKLAHVTNYNKMVTVSKDVSILLIEYRLYCEDLADKLNEHEEIQKAEIAHRYFKALKLAGTYAFIDNQPFISEANLYHAICMTEASGVSFKEILKRDKNYVKLAKYIASINHEITHVDLTEDLPFYKGPISQKQDLMQLAIAWGYKNQIIIKRSMTNGIEFIQGETLQVTDLNKIIISYSTHEAYNYKNVLTPFTNLNNLVKQTGKHWVNHHTRNAHRSEDNIISGFNVVVLDIDKNANIDTMKLLLEDYLFLYHTTKRHTVTDHRFRIIMPLNYHLYLDNNEFKEFMNNIYEWLPFDADIATGQRSRKWETYPGTYEYSKGDKLLDAMLFIPQTSKNDERKQIVHDYQSLSNLERWFIQKAMIGDRNNQLIRYALILVDLGEDILSVTQKVTTLNSKLPNKLTSDELNTTILKSAGKAIINKNNPTN